MTRRTLLFPLILLVLALSACTPIIVGDSISNMTRTQYKTAMPNVAVDAADGRGAYNAGANGQPGTGVEAIQTEIPNVAPGDWLVVELGSNNISFTHDERVWFITQVVNMVPNNICLGWVVPYVGFHATDVAGWAADLLAILPSQPCQKVVRWDTMANAHPEYFQDLVHPNAVGKDAFACLISKSIKVGSC